MISVLIADNQAVVREGLKQILNRTHDLRVQGEASNSLEAIRMVRAGHWDVMVLDLALPPRSGGLDLLSELKRQSCRLPVLVFSTFPEDQYGLPSLRAGAAGYLRKDSAPEEIVRAIRTLSTGQRYISPALADIMAERLQKPGDQPPHAALSEREFEVLVGLAGGDSPTEMARDLMLSVKTISTYRARILEKLHLKATPELVHYAIQHGLVPGLNPYI
jgi:two-component system invasion response regulator UvrY